VIPFRTASAITVWLLAVSPVFAQSKTADLQPDSLHLGTVYVGATIEASFMLREAGNDPKIKLDVRAPKFVKVRDKTAQVQNYGGPGKDFVNGIVEIALETKAAGEFKGELTVTLGKTTAKLPISLTVKVRRPGLSPVLIAATPFEAYTTSDGTHFQAWTDLVQDSTLDVNYLHVQRGKPVLRNLDLGKYVCVFLPADALVFVTPEDIKRVREYAEKGGWVVVTANHFFQGSVKKANAVLDGYGLQMQDIEAGFGQNEARIGKDGIAPELVKFEVESLRFYRASPIAVTVAKKAQVLVRAIGVGKAGDGFVVKAQAGKGHVIALGESLWWHWCSKEQAQGTDNAKLLRWLLSPS
jgi:hypothetical protein